MHGEMRERLAKISAGLSCRICPMRQCVGRCVLLRAADLIAEMDRERFAQEAEIVRLRRLAESEVDT